MGAVHIQQPEQLRLRLRLPGLQDTWHRLRHRRGLRRLLLLAKMAETLTLSRCHQTLR